MHRVDIAVTSERRVNPRLSLLKVYNRQVGLLYLCIGFVSVPVVRHRLSEGALVFGKSLLCPELAQPSAAQLYPSASVSSWSHWQR